MPRIEDDDLIHTIADSDSDIGQESSEDTATPIAESRGSKRKSAQKDVRDSKRLKQDAAGPSRTELFSADGELQEMDPDFDFQLDDGTTAIDELDAWTAPNGGAKPDNFGKDIDEIVARRKKVASNGNDIHVDEEDSEAEDSGMEGLDNEDNSDDDELLADDAFGVNLDDEDDQSGSDEDVEESGSDNEESEDDVAAPQAHPDDFDHEDGSDDEEDPDEAEKRDAFFAQESDKTHETSNGDAAATKNTFVDLSLSRPILKGLASAGFSKPTPIQRRTIPVAMLGKDVVGSAVTGSGKTAAFIIPILERLLYRSREQTKSRVAILMPTRELALQCYTVATRLASFTDITFGQAIGGLNQKEQERALRLRPDIVIATPGRFIDFMRNTSALALDAIEILVLDEADRMLEDGFANELNEILSTIPKSRQTMLFSATMTSSVDNLIRVGLNRPVRLMVDSSKSTVAGLTQEFVRLRPGREQFRLGCLLHLCTTSYTTRTIIFFRQKSLAHRVRVIFALLGLSAAELHGSMSQDQRINAMESFRRGSASFLLATDLASRGLDIKNVDAVVNFEAPQSHEIYLHRVGRTARAGRTGKACTLAAEPDRKIVKQAVKSGRANGAIIKQRTIPPEEAENWQAKVDALEDEIAAVLREEKEEKVMAQTEMQMRRTENLMAHEKEIMSRPKKTWFQGQKDKVAASQRGRDALNGVARAGGETGVEGDASLITPKDKKPKGKLSNKQKKKLDDRDEFRDSRLFKKSKADREGSRNKPAATKSGGKKGGKGKVGKKAAR